MIGMVMLMGVAVKNSILLVDYAGQLIRDGMDRNAAIIKSGKTRLRPILMTTMALIAERFPHRNGAQRSVQTTHVHGLCDHRRFHQLHGSDSLLVPAAFSYIDRYRVWSSRLLGRLFMAQGNRPEDDPSESKVASIH